MRHTSKLKSFAWYSVVSLLVALAVLVSVVRLTIGSVSEYRQHLQDMAGRYLGKPVAIAEMDARLIGIKPTVVLDEISLLDEESKEPLAHFSSVMIALNPLSSLRELRPVIDLSVHGANIVIALREDGTIQLQGVNLAPGASSRANSGALGAWLVSQSRLALKDSTLVWRDLVTGDEAVFAGVNLELQNLPNRHRLSGYVHLPKELGKELRVALDIHGDLLTQKDWEGELYVKAVRVHPAPWLQQFDYKGLHLEQGSVDLDIWSHWHGGLLEDVEGQFSLGGLKFSGSNGLPLVENLAGFARYTADDNGWRLRMDNLQIAHEDTAFEPLALQVDKNDAGIVLQASALPLELLHRYAPYLPQFHKAQREWLINAAPSGRLRNLRFELAEEGPVRAVVDIDGLRFSPWQRFPGVSNLSGRFAMDGSVAELALDASDLELALPRLFRQPLAMQRASGVVRLNRQGRQWRVAGDAVRVSNPDIKATVSFDSWIAPGEAPLISLEAQVQDGMAASVPRYLPVHIMSAASVDWLDKAFADGHVTTGRILLHGRANAFPYRENQGRFEVLFDAADVTLHYQNGWPDLKGVDGEVRFAGAGMEIEARRAMVNSSQLRSVRVGIADFRKPVLQVEGRTDTSMGEVLRFLQASPLAGHAGGALDRIQTRGNARVALTLAIPLSKSVARQHPLKVLGRGTFKEAEIQVADGVVFTGINGDLMFSENNFEAQAIHAQLFDAPALVRVFTEQVQGERARIVITGQGRASAAALRGKLDWPLLDRLDGETDWQARLTVPRSAQGGSELVVHSTLEGMAVNLPMPATKVSEGERPLTLTLPLGGTERRTHRFDYGDLVRVAWQQQSEPFRLLGAAVDFGGKGEAQAPRTGKIRIGGVLEGFPLREWLQLRKEIGGAAGRGELLPVEVEMQRLQLLIASPAQDDGAPLRAGDIPRIDFAVNDFAYGDVSLGRIQSVLRPEGKRLVVDSFRIAAPSFAAVASGEWVEQGDSQFNATLSGRDFGRMMRELGFASVITGGKIEASGRVSWPGSPAAFSLSKLAGDLHVKIEDGSLEEVKPGAGKLLGLLSLQALPRRLFLDFSDISEKGLQFSRIEGDINLADGNAYTKNLHLESLPANMLITGRTGLVQHDFDKMIAVVPNVSGTVSLAGALAWGPQVAAVLLVLQKLFQSDIDAATMTRYELTGSWDEPKLTRLDPVAPATADSPL